MEPSGVSYRQVGKQSNGKVIRGFIAGQSRNPGSAKSSIPSKFETTLFTGNKERDGFGTRSHRFVVVENELPGPGSYHTETDARLHDGKIYSKKGLGGGFVSKAKRDSAFGKLSDAPAPGTYNHKGTIQTSDGRHFSGSTSAFKPPTQRCVTLSEEPEPGPGQYNAAQAVEVVRRHGELKNANSMFASQSARIQKGNSATRDLPAPGQYEPRVADYKYSDDLLPSSAFRSGVPTTGQKGAQRMTKEQQLGVVACVGGAGNPGPGQYNSARSSFLLSRRRSPQFCESAVDRFGKANPGAPFAARTAPNITPGPGAYYREPVRETAPISSSSFMSGSDAHPTKLGDAIPGPAYYAPEKLESKRSYHLNAVQRWVPS